MGKAGVAAWEMQRLNVKNRTTNHLPGPRESMDLYLAVERGEPLNAPDTTPLIEQLNANAQREIWDPAPG